jgi:phosphoglycerate dehydrogenase-like enzyme
MRLRCALLDNFRDAARNHADWSPIADQVELVRFPEHLTTEERLAAALADFEVVVTASSSVPPVELTFALLSGLARQLVPKNTALCAGGAWQSTVGTDLNGACLGLLGLGQIGSRVVGIALAFGMRVVAWSPNLTAERAAQAGAELTGSKEELLARADFASIHLKLGERSRGPLGAAELGQMKPTAYLINTSRAAIVDQDTLPAALRQGTIARARALTSST